VGGLAEGCSCGQDDTAWRRWPREWMGGDRQLASHSPQCRSNLAVVLAPEVTSAPCSGVALAARVPRNTTSSLASWAQHKKLTPKQSGLHQEVGDSRRAIARSSCA